MRWGIGGGGGLRPTYPPCFPADRELTGHNGHFGGNNPLLRPNGLIPWRFPLIPNEAIIGFYLNIMVLTSLKYLSSGMITKACRDETQPKRGLR